jgi:RimJ/RimL family protein N-acetyltransferase
VIRIEHPDVVLRPLRDGDLPRLLEIQSGWTVQDGVHWPLPKQQLRQKIRGSGTWVASPVGLVLAVESEGRLVGELQARGGSWTAMPPGVFELGLEIFEESDRGRGLGRAAVIAITDHLFQEEKAVRVQISTATDNNAMRSLAEYLGFRFEGVLRGFMPTANGPVDHAMYGMTKSDHEDVTWT